jgi:hypothetical protein
MSVYLNTNQLKLRISQIEKRLAELSTMKEKIAFKSFKSESFAVVIDYTNSYGADAENQYNINKRLAINDLNIKVKRYDSELLELNTVLYERIKSDNNRGAYHDEQRFEEIERIQSAARYVEKPAVHLMPVFSSNGIGGFVGIGIHKAFVPSPTSVFVSPAHIIGHKSMRT